MLTIILRLIVLAFSAYIVTYQHYNPITLSCQIDLNLNYIEQLTSIFSSQTHEMSGTILGSALKNFAENFYGFNVVEHQLWHAPYKIRYFNHYYTCYYDLEIIHK